MNETNMDIIIWHVADKLKKKCDKLEQQNAQMLAALERIVEMYMDGLDTDYNLASNMSDIAEAAIDAANGE